MRRFIRFLFLVFINFSNSNRSYRISKSKYKINTIIYPTQNFQLMPTFHRKGSCGTPTKEVTLGKETL